MVIIHCDSNLCNYWNEDACMKKEIILEHNEENDLKCLSFHFGGITSTFLLNEVKVKELNSNIEEILKKEPNFTNHTGDDFER